LRHLRVLRALPQKMAPPSRRWQKTVEKCPKNTKVAKREIAIFVPPSAGAWADCQAGRLAAAAMPRAADSMGISWRFVAIEGKKRETMKMIIPPNLLHAITILGIVLFGMGRAGAAPPTLPKEFVGQWCSDADDKGVFLDGYKFPMKTAACENQPERKLTITNNKIIGYEYSCDIKLVQKVNHNMQVRTDNLH